MIQGRAGRRTFASAQQSNFTEVVSFGKISKHQLAAGILLAHLDEPDADEIEGIGKISLVKYDLAGRVAHQFYLLAQIVNKLMSQNR